MGLGMSEVVLILVIALIVFGPRKLPELGKSLGQAMAQFRKASDEFKRTWEQEVELENVRKNDRPALTGSGYDSNYHSESGYQAESDFNYGYETASETADNTASSATAHTAAPEATATAAATHAAANSAGQKAEAHWI